jgi:AsmA protein
MRWLKRVLLGASVVVVLLVVAAVSLPFVIPTSAYKGEIEDRVKAITGREFRLGGQLDFAVFSGLALRATDVTFGNRPGASAEPAMVKLKELDLKLRFWPLLSGRFEVTELVLREPVIVLEVDKDGKANWQIDVKRSELPKTAPGEAKPAAAKPGTPRDVLQTLQLTNLRVVQGTLRYRDARSGASYEVTKADLDLSAPSLDRPVRAKGAAEYLGKRLAFDGEIARPDLLAKGQASPFKLELGADAAKLTLAGQMTGIDRPQFAGSVKAEVPSVRAFAAWAGAPLVAGSGLGAMTLSAGLAATLEQATLKDLSIKLDATTATGELTIGWTGTPSIKGALAAAALDLRPYLAAGPAAPPARAPASPGGQPPAGQPPAGPPPAAGRSLPPFNADVKFDIKAIRTADVVIDGAAGVFKMSGHVATFDLAQVALYRGTANGAVRIDGTRPARSINARLRYLNLDVNALLVAFAGNDRLSGNASGDLDLTFVPAAASQATLASLNGRGALRIQNGAIKGYNLAGLFRQVGQTFSVQNLPNFFANVGRLVESMNRFDGAQKTDFAELSASYTARNGVLSTGDLRMQSPLLRVEGRGSVNLPARAVDMALQVKAVGTIQGQGSDFDKLGLAIPIRVTGWFGALNYRLDEGQFRELAQKAIAEKLTKGRLDDIKNRVPGLNRILGR